MNNTANLGNNNLSREEIASIKKASSGKKIRLRTKYGFKSLRKNPFKLIIAIAYIAAAIFLLLNTEQTIESISHQSVVPSTVLVFQIALSAVLLLFFLLLMALFGYKFKARKVENACISAGIFTKAKKAPFLLDRYKDKETPVIKILEIYLNGNTESDFKAKQKELESELEWKIIKFESKGTTRILLHTSPDNVNLKKNNRDDMNF